MNEASAVLPCARWRAAPIEAETAPAPSQLQPPACTPQQKTRKCVCTMFTGCKGGAAFLQGSSENEEREGSVQPRN